MSLLLVREGSKGFAVTVRKGSIGNKKGWCFETSNGLFISALYKTKREAEDQMMHYLETGKFDWYGSAEL